MAVTLPVALLAYEAFYHRPAKWSWSGMRAWLFGPGRLALCAVPLNLAYLYGKKFGPDALMNMPAYQPVFTLERFLTFQTNCITDLLFRARPIGPLGLLFTWTLLTWLAWRNDRPVLRFCWAFLIVAPLPIEFLGRYQAALYIPFAALAVFAATVLVDVADAAARFLASLPVLRRLGRDIPLAALLIAALFPYVRANWRIRNTVMCISAMVSQGPLTWKVIQQFRAVQPKVPPGSSVLILNDPFQSYDEVVHRQPLPRRPYRLGSPAKPGPPPAGGHREGASRTHLPGREIDAAQVTQWSGLSGCDVGVLAGVLRWPPCGHLRAGATASAGLPPR